jgi:hypothetical protein
MINTAGQHHNHHTDSIKAGSQKLYPGVRPHKQQHQTGCCQSRTKSMTDGVEHFLTQCQSGRFIPEARQFASLQPPYLSHIQNRFHYATSAKQVSLTL